MDRVKVSRPTRHKIGHFRESSAVTENLAQEKDTQEDEGNEKPPWQIHDT